MSRVLPPARGGGGGALAAARVFSIFPLILVEVVDVVVVLLGGPRLHGGLL